jgi:hypothetical protein
MNDPIRRLRDESTGPEGGDPFDVEAVLAEIHARTAEERPGGLTRRRRTVRLASVGAVGSGLVLAGALVLPGLVPGAGPGAGDLPVAEPSPTAEVRDGVVGEDQTADSTDATVVTAVAYVERARTAVQKVDLTTLVLEVESTFGVQHPGEPALDTSVNRQVTAGDGSAMRWISEKDFGSSVGVETVGDEEVHHVDPAGPEGQMSYWWVSPRAGVYTRFTMPAENWDDIAEGTGQEQASARIAEIGSTLDEVEALAALPDVVTSDPVEQTVAGRAATCFDLSGPGGAAAGAGAEAGDPSGALGSFWDATDWTRTTCFDDATDLPLSDTRSQHYYAGDAAEPSLSVDTAEYTWHPKDDASLALLQPSLDGLREVSRDEYVDLTS